MDSNAPAPVQRPKESVALRAVGWLIPGLLVFIAAAGVVSLPDDGTGSSLALAVLGLGLGAARLIRRHAHYTADDDEHPGLEDKWAFRLRPRPGPSDRRPAGSPAPEP